MAIRENMSFEPPTITINKEIVYIARDAMTLGDAIMNIVETLTPPIALQYNEVEITMPPHPMWLEQHGVDVIFSKSATFVGYENNQELTNMLMQHGIAFIAEGVKRGSRQMLPKRTSSGKLLIKRATIGDPLQIQIPDYADPFYIKPFPPDEDSGAPAHVYV